MIKNFPPAFFPKICLKRGFPSVLCGTYPQKGARVFSLRLRVL